LARIVANDVSSLLVQSQWSLELLIYRQWSLEILIFGLGLGVPAIKMKQSIKQKYSTFAQVIRGIRENQKRINKRMNVGINFFLL
jgi:hypothetical protein